MAHRRRAPPRRRGELCKRCLLSSLRRDRRVHDLGAEPGPRSGETLRLRHAADSYTGGSRRVLVCQSGVRAAFGRGAFSLLLVLRWSFRVPRGPSRVRVPALPGLLLPLPQPTAHGILQARYVVTPLRVVRVVGLHQGARRQPSPCRARRGGSASPHRVPMDRQGLRRLSPRRPSVLVVGPRPRFRFHGAHRDARRGGFHVSRKTIAQCAHRRGRPTCVLRLDRTARIAVIAASSGA
mmetsp:Transcript_70920/g.197051  ORF Transcript_70920/g.197051 Transcript_70920/m.197051 type:complete len:237 (-) Transcript_70920:52-762(-)